MLLSDAWHRRQAVAIASTLPEDIADAKIVLQLAMELVDGFLSEAKLTRTAVGAQASQPRHEDA